LFERLLVEALRLHSQGSRRSPNNTPNDTKGELMKLSYVRFLSAFCALAGFAVAGRAQAVDQVTVNIPYDFVVVGKTLPAGNYSVRRLSDSSINQLALTSFENRTGVLLISSEVAPTNEDRPNLTFEFDGSQHTLSKIETADHIFIIPVFKKPAVQVAMKKETVPATSGSSASSGSN
jgi:hypothetical protein